MNENKTNINWLITSQDQLKKGDIYENFKL